MSCSPVAARHEGLYHRSDMRGSFIARWVAAIAVVVCMLSAGCTRTVYVPQTSVQRDSIYITQYKRDSIYMHDSVFVHMKADTLIVERWRTRYVERLVSDTLYIEKADTLRIPYPVEKPLSTMQKIEIRLCRALLAVAAVSVIAAYIIYRIKRRRL